MTVLAEFFLNKEISENEINESYNQLESLIENMEFKMMLSENMKVFFSLLTLLFYSNVWIMTTLCMMYFHTCNF